MPLNLSNRDQNSGHTFYNRRLRAAITRFSVRMKHDDRKQQAALALSAVFVALVCGWMAFLQAIKPAGIAGESPIVGNRDTGAVYAKIDGRLHPALNLSSARLVTASPATPAWVTAREIDRYPTGPLVGIPGIPDELVVAGNPVSAWTLCDTAGRRNGIAPVVTAIGGQVSAPGRAAPMADNQAILAHHGTADYLIWNGRRSRIDLGDRALSFNLGLDTGKTHPVEISTALFDAMPATEPIVVPSVPQAGSPSRLIPGSIVGRVLAIRDAGGEVNGFYVLLPDGVQRITPFVADLLRAADSHGATTPQLVSPDTLLRIPEVETLKIDFYPTGKLTFVDSAVNPVTCVNWTKGGTDRQAKVVLLTGRGLPTPEQLDARIVNLVRDSRGPDSVEAQQTLMLPGATNLVVSTGGGVVGDTRESLFWVSPQGVRFGIERDPQTVRALGIDPDRAAQAPWPILRAFAAGPAISRAEAMLSRDAIAPATGGRIIPGADGEG